jgi:RNA polymerase sigma-70 factor, ECF subfamily
MTPAICFPPLRRIGALRASNKTEGTVNSSDSANDVSLIVKGCQRGDREAQRSLYESFAASVFRVAARIVGRQDAADVSQETFLKAFRSIYEFSGRANLGTWLYRVAVNESLQHLRRNKAARWKPLSTEPVDGSVSTVERHQQHEILERAIGLLAPELRAILILRETEDLSYKEISETLQISEGTVASRISRARQELRERLTDLGWDASNALRTSPRTVVRLPRQ